MEPFILAQTITWPASSKEPNEVLKSSLKLPDNSTVKAHSVPVVGVIHQAWHVLGGTLTADEKKWLVDQDDLRTNPPQQKSVPRLKLGLRMFHESEKRQNPDRFLPLYHETLGTTWNSKQWRFAGQDTEFPVFTKDDNWTKWI